MFDGQRTVITGLVPVIHVFLSCEQGRGWPEQVRP
jgi:hypothetical protein